MDRQAGDHEGEEGAGRWSGSPRKTRPLAFLAEAVNAAILEMCVENQGRPLAMAMTDLVERAVEAFVSGEGRRSDSSETAVIPLCNWYDIILKTAPGATAVVAVYSHTRRSNQVPFEQQLLLLSVQSSEHLQPTTAVPESGRYPISR